MSFPNLPATGSTSIPPEKARLRMEREQKDLMEFKSPLCPYTVTVRRNPPRRAKKTPATNAPDFTTSSASSTHYDLKDVPRFPIEEILQCEVPPLKTSTAENSENLRVFLRIRPLDIKKKSKKNGDGAIIARSRFKGISPKQDSKKKTKKKEICCLSVNDTRSVTLSPPQIMQDSRRVKTEVYDGFSHVFDSDSLQKQVYDRVMDPLVSDFIAGKSGMLAAMGPTGSGKTHTVFGCPREPGMVPLALQKIFNSTGNTCTSELSRSFYISMFEIYSERGKGERIFDLSSDGIDLCLQQSTIKGLQEVLVSNVVEAEALIGRGMLKRATAITNSNSQSSRSQCIINIRAAPKMFDGKVEVVPNNAVLTIVDLAGAEREKRTGNQGTRLLESNFINNTSMVFGLCLRSLLEHQKNPKKQFQKHFQNSLLTRYLRDYLEGKKRMTLILTVKPGEDDYFDTSLLLRQASPYMKIKFSTVEEPSNLPHQKRHVDKLPRVEQPKRRKLRKLDASEIDEDKSAINELPILKESCEAISIPRAVELEMLKSTHVQEACCIELARIKRREKITQNFSKALWNVLKQYKQKLEESEIEIRTLKEHLKEENVQKLMWEKELKDLKSSDSYCKHSTESSSGLQVGIDSKFGTSGSPQLAVVPDSSTLHRISKERLTPVMVGVDSCPPDFKASECNLEKCNMIEEPSQEVLFQTEGSDIVIDDCLSIKDLKQHEYQVNAVLTQSMNQNSKSFPEKENDVKDLVDLKYLEVKDNSPNPNIAATGLGLLVSLTSSSQSKVLVGDGKWPPMEQKTALHEELSDPRVSLNDEVGHVDACNARKSELERCSPCKSSNVEKPRRRLLPASSILLKEINGLDLEVENVEPKGSRGGRKLFAEERGLSQGSVSLLRLLRSNLHL